MKRLIFAFLSLFLAACGNTSTPTPITPFEFLAGVMDGTVPDETAVQYHGKDSGGRQTPLLAGCVRLKDNQPVQATGRDMFLSFTKPESHPEGLLLLSAVPEEIVDGSLYVGRVAPRDVYGESQFICSASNLTALWLNLADTARNDLGLVTLSLSGPLEIP